MVCAVASEQARQGITGNIAEIGVHHGRLFIILYLLASPGENALAVDLFSMQDRNIDSSGRGDLAYFHANMKRHAGDGGFTIHEGDSTELDGPALERLAGGKCRLISIDGGHTKEITAHDLGTAEMALAPGGVIILDDCFNEGWPGVSEGAYAYFQHPRNIVPFATGGNKTLFCEQRYARRYMDAVSPLGVKMARQSYLGAPIVCLEFTPLSWAERIGRMEAWKAVKNVPPLTTLRRMYRRTP